MFCLFSAVHGCLCITALCRDPSPSPSLLFSLLLQQSVVFHAHDDIRVVISAVHVADCYVHCDRALALFPSLPFHDDDGDDDGYVEQADPPPPPLPPRRRRPLPPLCDVYASVWVDLSVCEWRVALHMQSLCFPTSLAWRVFVLCDCDGGGDDGDCGVRSVWTKSGGVCAALFAHSVRLSVL